MSRDRVPKYIKQVLEHCHGGFELVGDAEEARLLAALPSKLTWRRRYNKDVPSDTGICSPYGWLEVRGVGGFNVFRNDEPLCHTTCRVQLGSEDACWSSFFVTRAAAQAAGESHMAQGWGDDKREPDGLAFEWQTQSKWPKPPRMTRVASASDVEDEHRFGLQKLRRLCHPWGYPLELAWIAEELSRPTLPQEVWADFALPVWRREAQGRFSLKTPYGELTVRRENDTGWVVERNGIPLRYFYCGLNLPGQKIVFDDYREAQARALLWTCYPEKEKLLHW
jgi:hypothetical protein